MDGLLTTDCGTSLKGEKLTGFPATYSPARFLTTATTSSETQ